MSRIALGWLACLWLVPGWANGAWQVVAETPSKTVLIEPSSIETKAGFLVFRALHVIHGGKIDLRSLRPVREVLFKFLIDCRDPRIATISRSVFSDQDALIDHYAALPHLAIWGPIQPDDPVFRRVCAMP